jgi:hypothetical protein
MIVFICDTDGIYPEPTKYVIGVSLKVVVWNTIPILSLRNLHPNWMDGPKYRAKANLLTEGSYLSSKVWHCTHKNRSWVLPFKFRFRPFPFS